MNLVVQTTVLVSLLCLILSATRRYNQFDNEYAEYFEYRDPYTYSKFCIVLLLLVLILNEGFRHGYQDTANYIGGYRDFSDDLPILLSSVKAKGFALFQWVLRRICADPQFIIIACAVVFNVADVYFIKKYAYDIPFSLYLWFLSSFFSNMNGLRQGLVAVGLMLAIPWVAEKKYVKYILLILLLSTFHSSVLIIIPLLFLFGGKRWNVGIVAFELFCLFSFFFPGFLNSIIEAYVTDDYAAYLSIYTGRANVINVLIAAVPLALGIIYHRNCGVESDRVTDVLINMQAIEFGFMVLAMSMAQYARIGLYMRNASILVTPFLIRKVFGASEKSVRIIAIVLYSVAFFVQVVSLDNWGAFRDLYLDFSILTN